ncbi:alcohol dehydrogenase catalytic domain-containing protein [Aeromicrobium sp. UC242_57]|uniref:alcohol dehydrogenase catalytic domain-containing protein n=1 Tax=Aeromicrobium sp. UC242_57 TaxID=3374624 RepID=UPI003794F89B
MSSSPTTMRALQYLTFGQWPEVVEVERPRAGPGQVLLRMTAAGVCHSDIGLLTRPQAEYPYGALPQTLGHEGAGVVAEIGAGAAGVRLGDDVLVYGPRGCGHCRSCVAGAENLCAAAPRLGLRSPGLGAPGTMAEYLLVEDPRHLVPLHGLDPVQHVSLSDAGLTRITHCGGRGSTWLLET